MTNQGVNFHLPPAGQISSAVDKGVPAALGEIVTLGHTLKKRADDVMAYFDQPRTSNGPTEAINGRIEHLRGSALGFRNLTNYIARALVETVGFRPQLPLHGEEPQTLAQTFCSDGYLNARRVNLRRHRRGVLVTASRERKRSLERQAVRRDGGSPPD